MIGIVELLKSKKATFCLIILACATTALLMKRMDGTSYAAVIATLATIYNFVQHRIDMQLPPKGTL